MPTLPSPWINKEVVCPDPPGDFLKLRLPLSRISKVWAVAFPRRDKSADREALPVTSRAVRGAVLPIPTFPEFCKYKTGSAASPASPPGLLWKFKVPLSRILKVWAVAAPLKDKLAEREA